MSSQKAVRWLPIWFVVLAIVLACGSSSTPKLVATDPADKATTAPTAPEAATAAPTVEDRAATATPAGVQTYAVGDVVSVGYNVLVVLGWSIVPGTDFVKPETGNQFVAVDVLIVNQGEKAASISSLAQTSLKDATAQKYTVDFSATTALSGSSIDGELAPGERVRGKVGFQVPEQVQGLQFVFNASLFSTGKVVVDLGAKPAVVDPPANLAGETTQTTYKIGEAIQIGDLMLTVNKISSPAGNEFTKPAADHKFLVVDVTIENKGAKAAAISTLLQMWVKNAGGQKYTLDLMATTAAKGATPDGELAAGEKVRGQVGYQVPTNATGLVFVFDGDVFGAGKVFVAVE